MIPSKANQTLAQSILNTRIRAGLKTDGDFGKKSIEAAQRWINWVFDGAPRPSRWVAAVIQKEATLRGISFGAADAFYGPDTSNAADTIRRQMLGLKAPERPDEVESTPSPAPSKIKCWSPTTAQFRARYGKEGANQGMVSSPFPLLLDWDLKTTVHRFSAHQSLVTVIENALRETLNHYGLARIKALGLNRFGGCLNVRNKRGGATPSVHSWGAAIDWFPAKNMLKQTKKTALFARPEYKDWLDLWESHGFMSLGRCFDFDWMHVQRNP
jgi:hypothetical protein